MKPISAALDLGSTQIKVALLDASGDLAEVRAAPFPTYERGERVEIDVDELARRAGALVRSLPSDIPLGVTSQRSSFVLFDAAESRPIAPALSWRDRRAATWCDAHPELASDARSRAGLRLSPHYAGPKIAMLLEDDLLRARVARGDVRFGTLDTYLLHRWSGGRVFSIDPSMAARTLMFDPRAGAWSARAVAEFGASSIDFPHVVESAGRTDQLDGGRTVVATIADQGSGLLAVAELDDVLVNLGTGGFVLRSVPGFVPQEKWLCGPIVDTGALRRFALEGTINGGAASVANFGTRLDDELLEVDPQLFCMPDSDGWGAPHWMPTRGVTYSRAHAAPQARRAAWFEGLVFRVREIIDAIGVGVQRVKLSGGLSRDPWLAAALASCLEHEVERVVETEATLLGVARLAAGLPPFAAPEVATFAPDPRWAFLARKFQRWSEWVRVGCPQV